MFAWTENYNVQETRRIAKEEGKREGKEEGKKEGEKEAIMKVARNLLEMGMALKEIIQATGLSEEKLQELNAQ